MILVSFGGPERTEDVIPFLENVLRGRNVPRARLLEVAGHYYHFGGRSPNNDQCRELIAALRQVIDLPIYWGNRNWHPLLTDTLRQMRATFPVLSIRKVERSTPIYFRPYMDFSTQTP